MNPASTGVVDNGVGENLLESLQRLRRHEIEEARRLQLAMIPAEPLRVPAAELLAKIRPVSEVGGDFLDYFQIPDGRIGFYLGDVVGKGLPAALYAALTIGTLRGFNKHMETPCSLLAHLNQRLRVHSLEGRYCAVQYGLFEPETRRLEFANAGLPLPLHLTEAGPRWVGEGGFPSGLLDQACYKNHTLKLAPGESVIFYTDGIAEAATLDREEFGYDRLASVLSQNPRLPPEELLDRLLEAVDDFAAGVPQHDDMTVLILRAR